MNPPTNDRTQQLRQKLAAIEHERWSDWQKYMHSRGVKTEVGNLIIPRNSIVHWEAQIDTPYDLLTPYEQASDMEQVDRYWSLIENYVAAEQQMLLDRVGKEIIGEDDQYQTWSDQYHRFLIHREELVDDRNELRTEQRKALASLKAELGGEA